MMTFDQLFCMDVEFRGGFFFMQILGGCSSVLN